MFNLKKVFGMNKTQVITLYRNASVPALAKSVFYCYDDDIRFSHKPIVIKKIMISCISDADIEILNCGGQIGYSGKKPFDLVDDSFTNQALNKYVFDDKKPHDVNLYVAEGVYSYLSAVVAYNNTNPTQARSIEISIYIEFEVL